MKYRRLSAHRRNDRNKMSTIHNYVIPLNIPPCYYINVIAEQQRPQSNWGTKRWCKHVSPIPSSDTTCVTFIVLTRHFIIKNLIYKTFQLLFYLLYLYIKNPNDKKIFGPSNVRMMGTRSDVIIWLGRSSICNFIRTATRHSPYYNVCLSVCLS